MFVSHDKSINKKKFQKPNILRRKPKIPAVKLKITAGSCESLEQKSLLSAFNLSESSIDGQEEKVTKRRNSKPVQMQCIKKLVQTNPNNYERSYEVQITGVEVNDFELNTETNVQAEETNTVSVNHEGPDEEITLNVESFLVSSTNEDVEENITLLENDIFHSKTTDIQDNQKWCFELNGDFTESEQKLILEECEKSQEEGEYLDQKSDYMTPMVPLSEVSAVDKNRSYEVPAELTSDDLTQQFFSASHKFKCDVTGCNKEFMSEQKLKKHKNIHNKAGFTRVPKQTISECPVKKTHEDGTEEPCGMSFQIREQLLKHLNEDHQPEDAIHRCEECGRRFFWASGLRAHGRAHRARRSWTALACSWPGCGRVFRQPCRLREHTRAHTGDKPYPCRYPNCGWSFRTASKLVRHARRHTGERRHACTACGRAFLRREHLRDHTARHHERERPPRRARSLLCEHDGCQHTFSSMNSLYTHMKKVHLKDDDSVDDTSVQEDTQSMFKTDSENIFMVTYMPGSSDMDTASAVGHEGVRGACAGDEGDTEEDDEAVEAEMAEAEMAEAEMAEAEMAEVEMAEVEIAEMATGAGEGETHAARTHCTWPLAPRAAFAHADAYVLEEEEDVKVESCETSESNIYTVRSDLFLHGNELTNEDSEHMAGARSCGAALDAELLLAPSVDIAQEELYSDAVDESAFRVFLLSGEDLT